MELTEHQCKLILRMLQKQELVLRELAKASRDVAVYVTADDNSVVDLHNIAAEYEARANDCTEIIRIISSEIS